MQFTKNKVTLSHTWGICATYCRGFTCFTDNWQILSHKQNKRLLKNFKKPRDIIQSQKTTKLWSFLTVLLEIQNRNQNRTKRIETKVSLIFPTVSRQPNGESETHLKQLTFYFSFEKPRRLRNSKLCEWEWRLYQTSVHLAMLYQIFRAWWWMWNRLSERRGWSAKVMNVWRSGRRGWVREALKCESERVRLVWFVWERVREWIL